MSETHPTEPGRFKAFANFFKGYMGVSSVLVAILPVPVASLKLIPTYASQTGLFSVYTSMFCFLTLGFIFYSRHALARLFFPEALGLEVAAYKTTLNSLFRRLLTWTLPKIAINILPLILIFTALFLVYRYNEVLVMTINYRQVNVQPEAGTAQWILQNTAIDDIHCNDMDNNAFYGVRSPTPSNDSCASLLMFLYIGIFVCAEAAFILMAIREYLQDLLKFSEIDLIRGFGSKADFDSTGDITMPSIQSE